MAAPKRPQLDKGATKNPFVDAMNASRAYYRGAVAGYNHAQPSPKGMQDKNNPFHKDPGFSRPEGNGGMLVDVKTQGGRP